jgi:hypothetical protein
MAYKHILIFLLEDCGKMQLINTVQLDKDQQNQSKVDRRDLGA